MYKENKIKKKTFTHTIFGFRPKIFQRNVVWRKVYWFSNTSWHYRKKYISFPLYPPVLLQTTTYYIVYERKYINNVPHSSLMYFRFIKMCVNSIMCDKWSMNLFLMWLYNEFLCDKWFRHHFLACLIWGFVCTMHPHTIFVCCCVNGGNVIFNLECNCLFNYCLMFDLINDFHCETFIFD